MRNTYRIIGGLLIMVQILTISACGRKVPDDEILGSHIEELFNTFEPLIEVNNKLGKDAAVAIKELDEQGKLVTIDSVEWFNRLSKVNLKFDSVVEKLRKIEVPKEVMDFDNGRLKKLTISRVDFLNQGNRLLEKIMIRMTSKKLGLRDSLTKTYFDEFHIIKTKGDSLVADIKSIVSEIKSSHEN